MDSSLDLRRLGVALIAVTGLLHLILSPEYLSEKTYVGVLFILGGLTALAIAVKLWRAPDMATWAAGSVLAASMAIAFILSRTTGLPGYSPSEWEISGVISVLIELGFVGVALKAVRTTRTVRTA